MRKNDIASLVLIIAVGFTISLFMGNALFNKPESRSTQVEVVSEIGGQLPEPDTNIFNKNALNPTEDIRITPGETDTPFAE